jgi:hypothetical protein
VCIRNKSSSDQFTEGAAQLWPIVLQQPRLLQQLFVSSKAITYNQLKKLYKVEFSPAGSNKRMMEDDTMFSWECFLKECEGSIFKYSF